MQEPNYCGQKLWCPMEEQDLSFCDEMRFLWTCFGLDAEGDASQRKLMSHSGEERFPIVGVSVIITRDGKMILGKRQGSHGAGTWALPGGKVDWHEEKLESTAERETLEETGLAIKNITYRTWTNDIFKKEDKHFVTMLYTAEMVDESAEPELVEPEKCSEWAWFTWEEVKALKEDEVFIPLWNLIQSGFEL
eukprot:TRINITY_DN2603_c0_g1_i1.p2 TRINITY_DN2603_c0_g1~~TRINITY_DN2603_c0_g1_i1.p2  ORF type:complete len:192 (+),score=51.28 TRINITY_DN2603_c0_g1_i1:890-1465(+)